MRVTLPESNRTRRRSIGGTVFSTVAHVMVIGGTVVATGYSSEGPLRISKPDQVTLIAPRAPAPVEPPARSTPRVAIPTNVEPLPQLQVPRITASIPEGLPPIDARIGTTMLETFASTARDTAVSRGLTSGSGTEPYTEVMVEKAVMPRDGNPPPRYPSMLANAGVEAVLYAQFVVDTTGRVERASVRFPHGGHALFQRAVTESLLRSRFVPAEFGGRRVRQLVEQPFAFAIQR